MILDLFGLNVKKRTGSTLLFDRNIGAIYGTWDTPITGTITLNTLNAIEGGTVCVLWSGAETPTFAGGEIAATTGSIDFIGTHFVFITHIDGKFIVNLVSGIAIVVGSEINWDIISNVIEEPTDGNIYKGTLAGGQNGLYNYAGSTTPLVGDFDISIEARQQTLNTGGGYWRFGVDFSDSLTYVSAGVFSFDYGLQGINATGNIASFRRVGGASGTIQTLPYNTGDVLRIVRSGTTIMLYFNTNLLATFTGVSTANMYPYMAMATNTFIWNPIKS